MIELVIQSISDYMRDHGIPEKEIAPDDAIMAGLGLDSLGLAVIVLDLEDKTGKDPFASGFINFRTVRELATLYENA